MFQHPDDQLPARHPGAPLKNRAETMRQVNQEGIHACRGARLAQSQSRSATTCSAASRASASSRARSSAQNAGSSRASSASAKMASRCLFHALAASDMPVDRYRSASGLVNCSTIALCGT